MGIENNLQKMLTPDDALLLCDGFFEDKTIARKILNEKNLLDAAETLIEIGYENDRPYKSRCDVLETALRMGWFPCDWPQETIASNDSTKSARKAIAMSKLKLRYWVWSSVSMVIGVALLVLSHKVSDKDSRFIAFSSGAFLTSGFSRIVWNLVKEDDCNEA